MAHVGETPHVKGGWGLAAAQARLWTCSRPRGCTPPHTTRRRLTGLDQSYPVDVETVFKGGEFELVGHLG